MPAHRLLIQANDRVSGTPTDFTVDVSDMPRTASVRGVHLIAVYMPNDFQNCGGVQTVHDVGRGRPVVLAPNTLVAIVEGEWRYAHIPAGQYTLIPGEEPLDRATGTLALPLAKAIQDMINLPPMTLSASANPVSVTVYLDRVTDQIRIVRDAAPGGPWANTQGPTHVTFPSIREMQEFWGNAAYSCLNVSLGLHTRLPTRYSGVGVPALGPTGPIPYCDLIGHHNMFEPYTNNHNCLFNSTKYLSPQEAFGTVGNTGNRSTNVFFCQKWTTTNPLQPPPPAYEVNLLAARFPTHQRGNELTKVFDEGQDSVGHAFQDGDKFTLETDGRVNVVFAGPTLPGVYAWYRIPKPMEILRRTDGVYTNSVNNLIGSGHEENVWAGPFAFNNGGTHQVLAAAGNIKTNADSIDGFPQPLDDRLMTNVDHIGWNPVDLSGVQQIEIHSSKLTNKTVYSTYRGFHNTIGIVGMGNIEYGQTLRYEVNDPIHAHADHGTAISVDLIDIKLTNTHGGPLFLPDKSNPIIELRLIFEKDCD